MNPFLQLAVEKKDSKNGAARKYFGPSYFVTALAMLFCLPSSWPSGVLFLKKFSRFFLLCLASLLAADTFSLDDQLTSLAKKLVILLDFWVAIIVVSTSVSPPLDGEIIFVHQGQMIATGIKLLLFLLPSGAILSHSVLKEKERN